MDGHDGILPIVLTPEHLFDLASLDLSVQGVERLTEFQIDPLARFRPLEEHGEVIGLPAQRIDQLTVLLEPPSALEHTLRFGLILPEVG
jgi:hypothetical protein